MFPVKAEGTTLKALMSFTRSAMNIRSGVVLGVKLFIVRGTPIRLGFEISTCP